MKKTFTTLFLSVLMVAPLSAQDIVSSETENTIRDLFSASLQGKDVTMEENAEVSVDKISATREKVWQIWRSAVEGFDEEKLFPVTELELRKTGSWTLPSELEPNAKMPFYWGCNAEKVQEGTKYPMFLYMHGSGDKNQEWETGIGLSLRRFHSPGIYFVPQIPNTGDYYRWAIQSKQWAWEKLLRLAFLTEEVDANKIYFFGISEGAYGSQRLASFYADYLAGAGPMAGGEPLRNAPMENVANIAFSLRTGALDDGFSRNKLTQKALEVADALEKEHPGYYKHFIEVIPSYGHSIDYSPTTPWLAKYSRDPHPDYFYWENFDMYGRKREGFHNLRVLFENLLSTSPNRVCYEYIREGNTVNLNLSRVNYTTTYAQNGVEIDFNKKYLSVKKGTVRLYLNEKEYDLTQPVKVLLNGKEIFSGMVRPDLKTMVESCAFFYDPERVFAASIDIDVETQSAVPTNIDVIEASPTVVEEESIYDLSGRRVLSPKKNGIYVSNGRAILVR